MKIYIWLVIIVLFSITMIGGVLPFLFSAKQNEAVMLGVFIAISFPVILFNMVKKLIKGVNNEKV